MGSLSSRIDTVMVTGYSAAPMGTSMHAVFGHCGVVLEVDPAHDAIVAAEFTVVTRLANDFLGRLCVGRNLLTEAEQIVADFGEYYLAPSSSAMVSAVRSAAQRYADSRLRRESPDAGR